MQQSAGQRLRLYLERTNKLQKQLTDITGIRKEFVSDWMSGKKQIPAKHLETILKTYHDLSARWLLTGEGNMIDGEGKKIKSRERLQELSDKFDQILVMHGALRQSELEALKIMFDVKDELSSEKRKKKKKIQDKMVNEST